MQSKTLSTTLSVHEGCATLVQPHTQCNATQRDLIRLPRNTVTTAMPQQSLPKTRGQVGKFEIVRSVTFGPFVLLLHTAVAGTTLQVTKTFPGWSSLHERVAVDPGNQPPQAAWHQAATATGWTATPACTWSSMTLGMRRHPSMKALNGTACTLKRRCVRGIDSLRSRLQVHLICYSKVSVQYSTVQVQYTSSPVQYSAGSMQAERPWVWSAPVIAATCGSLRIAVTLLAPLLLLAEICNCRSAGPT